MRRMESHDQMIEGVKVGDEVLENPPEEAIPVWGGATVSENSATKEACSIPPKENQLKGRKRKC